MAQFLVSNSLPDPMNVETQSPLEKTLTGVVIHTVAVVVCRKKFDILQLFVCLLENPSALQVCSSYQHFIHESSLQCSYVRDRTLKAFITSYEFLL